MRANEVFWDSRFSCATYARMRECDTSIGVNCVRVITSFRLNSGKQVANQEISASREISITGCVPTAQPEGLEPPTF